MLSLGNRFWKGNSDAKEENGGWKGGKKALRIVAESEVLS